MSEEDFKIGWMRFLRQCSGRYEDKFICVVMQCVTTHYLQRTRDKNIQRYNFYPLFFFLLFIFNLKFVICFRFLKIHKS